MSIPHQKYTSSVPKIVSVLDFLFIIELDIYEFDYYFYVEI